MIGAPLADGMDLDGVALATLRHAVWEGFVLVNFSGDAPDPGLSLAGLSDAEVEALLARLDSGKPGERETETF